MAFMCVIGNCYGCSKLFSFNPNYVPSIRPTPEAPREPICRECIEKANSQREASGLPPFQIHPEAYTPEEVE